MWSGTWGDGQCHGSLTSVRLCSRPQTWSWREKEKGGGIGLMMWFLFQTNENATKNVRSLRTFIRRKNPCCVFLTLVFAAKKEKTKRHKWTEKGNQLVYLWTLSTFLYVILLLGRMAAVLNLMFCRKYVFLLYFFISQRRIWEAEMPWSFSWSVLG